MSAEAGYHPTIMELPSNERPRERLLDYGASALSNAELLAIILRVGAPDANVILVAQNLLSRFGGWAGLAQASTAELTAVRGIGVAKVAQLKASLEIGRRLLVACPPEP